MKLSHSHSACLCLRVDAETESIGLDLSQHGERAHRIRTGERDDEAL